MITLKNAQTITGKTADIRIQSPETRTIDATGLTYLPGLIDPHVHFRTPGHEHKENWISAAKACMHGGYTTVLDMPNNSPACVSETRLRAKIALIEEQLKTVDIPLRYGLYLGADRNHLNEIPKVQGLVVGVKVFMGASTGDLLMDDESSLHAVFAICARLGFLVAVHAEDECDIQARRVHFQDRTDFAVHSEIRSPEVAETAVKLAIDLARLYGTRLYILHVSTLNELRLITAAKQEGLAVYAEACPHHLCLTTAAYPQLGAKAQMNPPLRSAEHQAALWQAIRDGVIDTIGSDHAPHTIAEKNQPYGKAPSGVPGMETTLPLLLNAYHQGKLSLTDIVRLTHDNPKAMFNLPDNDDAVLVDLQKTQTVDEASLFTRCGWSPFAGQSLKGWPVMTILRGRVWDQTTLNPL